VEAPKVDPAPVEPVAEPPALEEKPDDKPAEDKPADEPAEEKLEQALEEFKELAEPIKEAAPADAQVLPIPATVPANPSWALVSEFRARFSAEGSPVVGHFGTFGDHVAGVLTPTLERLLREEQHVNVALIGTGSDVYRDAFVRLVPAAANRIHATGRLKPDAVAAAVRACDVMVQPYPDGVTTRRTSVMAPLANETATVTTDGALTEPAWRESDGVRLVPVFDPASAVRATIELLRDPAARAALARRGGDLYRSEFALDVTIAKLRAVGAVAR